MSNPLTQYHVSDQEAKSLRGLYDHPACSLPCPGGDYTYWVIKEDPSGLLFSDQVGGFACLHPTINGVLYSGGQPLNRALRFVEKYVYNKYGGYCVPHDHFFCDPEQYEPEDMPGRQLNEEDADYIDSTISGCGFPGLVVDRSRLKQSCEAWIYGLMDGAPCVFVMGNSD